MMEYIYNIYHTFKKKLHSFFAAQFPFYDSSSIIPALKFIRFLKVIHQTFSDFL